MSTTAPRIRLAELVSALSVATDLAMGQPLEFALNSCVLAMRIGDALGVSDQALREIYFQSLLRYVGCNAETSMVAAITGDELELRREFVKLDTADQFGIIKLVLRSIRRVHEEESPLSVAREMFRGLGAMPKVTKTFYASHCEVAERLGARLGFESSIVDGLGQLYERWDGKGAPAGLKGEAISLAVRVVTLAQDIVIFNRLSGSESAIAVIKERRGAAYDPSIVDLVATRADSLLKGLEDDPAWSAVLSLEPGRPVELSDSEFETALTAMADFADIKSPFMVGHARAVSDLASDAAGKAGLPATDVEEIRHASLLHDLGRSGVSSQIWSKAGALAEREWDQVRLFPYHTERVLARPDLFARLGRLASASQERIDGTGYHRGAVRGSLAIGARLIAIADAYRAMIEERPYRPARSADYAAMELKKEAASGRFDSDLVECVLSAAGHRVRATTREATAGLTERELEILREVARGHTKKETGNHLSISEKTVDNHVQHIYEKIGVTTRAAAAVWAVERGLLD